MNKIKVRKAVRTLRMAENGFKPANYWVYEVVVRQLVVKKFANAGDAKRWAKANADMIMDTATSMDEKFRMAMA